MFTEADDGKDFLNKLFTNLSNDSNVKRYSRYTSLRAVLVELFNRTINDVLKKTVFQKVMPFRWM